MFVGLWTVLLYGECAASVENGAKQLLSVSLENRFVTHQHIFFVVLIELLFQFHLFCCFITDCMFQYVSQHFSGYAA